MGKVVPLQNVYCNLKRLEELQAIGDLLIKAEQLFSSLNPAMSYAYRDAIVKRAVEFLTEANERRELYFKSQGKASPPRLYTPGSFKEN